MPSFPDRELLMLQAQPERNALITRVDFSLRALYDALDAQRRTRGISWAMAASTRWTSCRVRTTGRRPARLARIASIHPASISIFGAYGEGGPR